MPPELERDGEGAPTGAPRSRAASIARGVFGESRGAVTVAGVSLVSLLAFLGASAAVQSERESWPYGRFLLQRFLARPSFGVLAVPDGVAARDVALLGAWLAACIAAGMLAARAAADRDGDGEAIGWSVGLGVAVVPPAWLAFVLWPDGRGFLTSTSILGATVVAALAVAVAWSRTRRPGRPGTGGPAGAREEGWWWVRVCLVAVVTLAVSAWLDGYSDIRGFDSYGYHLPLAASWLRHARLVTGPEEALNFFYPGNFELLVRWALSLGTDRLAFSLSFISAVLCVWVLYRICLEIGQPRPVAAMSAVAAASLQVLVLQSTTIYSDTFTTFALELAVWLLLRWWRQSADDLRLSAATGLALGIAAGSKYSAVPPALLIVVVWLWGMWRHGGVKDRYGLEYLDRRWARRQLLALIVPALAASLYWYLRNLIEHGNPVFPVSVGALNGVAIGYLIPLRPELATPGWRWLTYPWGEWGFGTGSEDGLGPTFAAVALVGLAAVPFMRSRERPLRTVLWVVTLGAFALWLRSGILVPRYGLLPLMLSFAFVGELWLEFGSGLLRVITAACVVASTVTLSAHMLANTAYVEFLGARRTGVPAVVDSLPRSRIFNAAGQPAGYFAMGRDYRHTVTTLYREPTPLDVQRLAPDYVLLPTSLEPRFTAELHLTLVARWTAAGREGTSLWKFRR